MPFPPSLALALVVGCAEPPTPERADAPAERLHAAPAWESAQNLDISSLAWADRDLDGDLDLAVGYARGAPPQVWDNDGGSMSLAWTAPPASAPFGQPVEWGDLDGDGDPDLATAGWVYENDGVGLLAWWHDPAPDVSWDLAWGDADGDGTLDLARAGADGTSVLRNTGATFVEIWSSPIPDRRSWDVVWADVDGDADLDLAEATGPAVGQGWSAVTLWKNVGAGFAEVPIDDVYVHELAFGDYDADGDPDLALAGDGYWDQVLRNDGGTLVPFWSWPNFYPDSPYTQSVAWADWDGDGDDDLAFGSLDTAVWTYDGAAFVSAWTVAQDDSVRDVAWGDWDGDGDPDLATGGWGPLRIYANDTTSARLVALPPTPGSAGTTTSVRVIGATPGATLELYAATSTGAAAAPGCGGLRLGLAGANRVGNRPVADAAGRATFRVEVPLGAAGASGHLQVLEPSACEVGPVVPFTVPDAFRAEDVALASLEGPSVGEGVAGLGDLDGDGIPEVMLDADDHSVVVVPADAGPVDPNSALRLVGEAGDYAGDAIAARDVTGDGRVEVLLGAIGRDRGFHEHAGGAYLLTGPLPSRRLRDATARFLGEDQHDHAGSAVGLSTDLTGDGAWDVVLGADGRDLDAGGVYVLDGASSRNDVDLLGAPTLALVTGAPVEHLGAALAVADLDGDGMDDLLAGSLASGGTAYALDAPVGGVVPASTAARVWDGAGTAFAVGDLDGDGDADLAAGTPEADAQEGAVLVLDALAPSGPAASLAWASIDGTLPSAKAGYAVLAEDLDGDGAADLVVGSPRARNALGEDTAGRIDVFYGPLAAGATPSDASDLTIEGASRNTLGGALDVVGDVDGDGRLELVVGAESPFFEPAAVVVPTL